MHGPGRTPRGYFMHDGDRARALSQLELAAYDYASALVMRDDPHAGEAMTRASEPEAGP